MLRAYRRPRRLVARASLAGLTAASVVTPAVPVLAQTAPAPMTPIQHVIIIIGENRTFDHVFATYQPKSGQTVNNLLSQGIVKADGTPGPNFALAAQNQASDTGAYTMSPGNKSAYSPLPPPSTDSAPSKGSDSAPPPFATVATATAFEAEENSGLAPSDYQLLATGATGLTGDSADTRVTNANNLPNGPFQITGPNLPYDSYTASPVHRFYQMRQQTDCAASHITAANPSGCLNDLFPWVEITVGTGSNGGTTAPANNLSTGEGSASMGFYNMSTGDVPYFKQLADQYTMSDNFHQSIMGGTGANHVALGTGLADYYTDGQGHIATPPSKEIENPNAQSGTNNFYTQDGYSGGSYSNCSDTSQPGVAAVTSYLNALPNRPRSRCEAGAYYLLNNYNPGYYGDGTVNTSTYTIPPSPVPTIGDTLNAAGVSWAYYGGGWKNYLASPNGALGELYCNICNPFLYETKIMTDATQRATHLADVSDFEAAVAAGTLPAVSFVKPDTLVDGHPASSKLNLFEAFSRNLVNQVQANPKLWAHTAILITWDEGGGYWDSGYIQPVDFFGDGTRIPAIMVSPYSAGGKVTHTYADHVSFLKFIEKNWRLRPVSLNGRDNLPDPIAYTSNPYVPVNSPAIGDLMDMFNFSGH